MSVVKLVVWWIEFALGGLILRTKAIRAGALVIFDRYFFDLLVDPIRYRYGGPSWAARLVARLVPPTDFSVFADAPSEVMQSRKSEVPPLETERQRSLYRHLATTMRSITVDTTEPVETSALRVEEWLLREMEQDVDAVMARKLRQIKRWFVRP